MTLRFYIIDDFTKSFFRNNFEKFRTTLNLIWTIVRLKLFQQITHFLFVDSIYSWKFSFWFLKVYYSLILFIHENLLSFNFIHSWKPLLPFNFIYSWSSFTFYLFIRVFSHIPRHSCKIHGFSYIFFEHFHDFRTHTYVQIKIKFSKIAFLSKYCKFDIWSYSFSRFNHMNFFFFQNLITFFFNLRIWLYSFLFLWKKRDFTWKKEVSHEKKNFTWKKKKNLISSLCSKFEFIEYRMKRISFWISLITTSHLNIVKHDISLEFNWT